MLESEGGTKHDFKLDFATEKEAEQFASDMDWRYVDENQFEWRLAVEEDATAEKQAIKNRHTEEVEAESISYAAVSYTHLTRPGNPQLVELAKRQVGNVGGYPYWSWYGFDSRVEWCACFVSWCYNQAGKNEPRFAGCEWQGVPWFQSHGQWGARGYNNLAPGDAIFFDWDLDGTRCV